MTQLAAGIDIMRMNLFNPESKVHKQRNIMRDTDSRLATYSSRAISLSLIVFFVAMFLGDYRHSNPVMFVVFSIGIVATTLIRVFFLLRFDSVYSHAPSRWRNIYFFITLVSAFLWGTMLAHVTYRVGLQSEVPLLWLYTIAFFSSCSHVFSPYQRFYSIYLSLTLLPCALVALLSFRLLDDVYGIIMLLLIALLHRQGKGQGKAYWERLQANYDLTQKANALEAEKISSESDLSNNNLLFQNVVDEIRTTSQEIQGSLQILNASELPDHQRKLTTLAEEKGQQQIQVLQNIQEYSRISRDEIILKSEVFDVRDCIEKAIASVSKQIYKKKNEIFVQFSKDFPVTVRGDADRVEQMLINTINCALDYAEPGSLLLTVIYQYDLDQQGRLRIEVGIENPIRNSEIEQRLNDAFKPYYAANMSQGLSLAIAKGLANSMQGNMGAHYTDSNFLQFWLTVSVVTVTPSSQSNQHIAKLSGKRLLLYQPPKIIEMEYKHTLESWGIVVDIIYEYEAAIAAISHSIKSTAFDLIMIYTKIDDLEGLTLAKVLSDKTKELSTPQILCMTENQSKLPSIEQLLENHPQMEVLIKPFSYKTLKQTFKKLLLKNEKKISATLAGDFLSDKSILLLQDEEIDQTIAMVMLEKLGCNVKAVNTPVEAVEQLASTAFDAFITESNINSVDMREFIETAKKTQFSQHNNGYELPILGISHKEKQGEETHCLQCGMNYFIDSPLQIDDLRAILRRWIGRAVHLAGEG